MKEKEKLDFITQEIIGAAIEVQLLSYLRLSNKNVGLLINFHVRLLKNGVKRIVHEFPDSALSAISAVNSKVEAD